MTDDVLNYAPKPALGRRRAFRRWAGLGLALGLVAGAWRWGGPWWAQGRYLYEQHRAMAYAPPADFVVFDNDPAAAKALLGNARAYRPPARPLFNRPWYPVPPPTWQPPAFHFHPAFDRLGIASVGYGGVVFGHRRRAPGGAVRLVCVTAGCSAFGPEGTTLDFHAEVFVPAGWRPGATVRPAALRSSVQIPITGRQRLRVFAGQPDPADASHFTIHYEIDGQPGTIDGWLRDHGDPNPVSRDPWRGQAVGVKIRDGPAALPPADAEDADEGDGP